MRESNLPRRLAGAMLVLLLAACDSPVEPGGLPETGPDAEAPAPAPGIHPVLSLSRPSPDLAEVSLELHRVEVVAAVAAYQVELVYDAERLKVVDGRFPEGVLGAWFEVEPGRIRVAGARLDGMQDGAIVSLRFATPGPEAGDAFGLRVEELSSAGAMEDLRPLAVVPDRLPLRERPSP